LALWPPAGQAGAAQVQPVPAAFLGHWATSTADCLRGGIGGSLLAMTQAFHFPQGFGRLVSVRQLGASEVELQMAMTGEARGRVEARRYIISPDLRTLTELAGPGFRSVLVRTRCAGVPLPPVDEAVSNESFRAFRTELLGAIDRKDKAFILSIVSPKIMNSFGGDGGIQEFEEGSRLDDDDSWFWKEFGTVMRMGGSSPNPDSFAAPYLWTQWPDLDAWHHVAVIGKDVKVRAAPSIDSAVIATLSYRTILNVGTYERDSQWTHVSLDDGRTGYVDKAQVRSPISYRARFSRRDGRWWLDAFIAGD
jgi:hypothetical protein